MTALSYPGTFSKAPQAWGFEDNFYLKAGRGAEVQASDDLWYLDLTSSLGQNLLGYDPKFAEYVSSVLKDGIGFTLPHYLEYATAELLANILEKNVPGFDPLGVRFGKTGSDVTQAAITLARATTGKQWLIKFKDHYHGWGPTFVAASPPGHGLVVDRVDKMFNPSPSAAMRQHKVAEAIWQDENSVRTLLAAKRTAAIIFEHPVGEPAADWPKTLRKLCDESGALLIADEVVTGLRYGLGGVSGLYGYEPDLMCLGKGLGNGAAVSALVGRKMYMDWFAADSPVFWSSTSNGNASDLAAAHYVLTVLNKEAVERLWVIGEAIKFQLSQAGWTVFGDAPRSVLRFNSELERGFFVQRMRHYHVLANRPNFPNLAFDGMDIQRLGEAASRVKREFNKATPKELERHVKLPKVLFKER